MSSSYMRFTGSDIVHKTPAAGNCFYVDRATVGWTISKTKPRDCHVCDECQRLEKKARLEIKVDRNGMTR